MLLLELKLELDFLEAYLKFWKDPSGYQERYSDTKKGYIDTLKGIWILWDKGFQILKETTLRKHEILDRFDTLLDFHINLNHLNWSSYERLMTKIRKYIKSV